MEGLYHMKRGIMDSRKFSPGYHVLLDPISVISTNVAAISGSGNHNVVLAGTRNCRPQTLIYITNFLDSKPWSTLCFSTEENLLCGGPAKSSKAPAFPSRRTTSQAVIRAANINIATSPVIAGTYGGSQELIKLLELVPEYIREKLLLHEELEELVEIVLDLGRRPLARFPSGDWFISHEIVSSADLEHAVSLVGEFADDNRAGMDRTLHRVSAIRNRAGRIVGLTCRVGRAISGSAEMARDLVASGGSLLLMGPPGVGKTTAIREVARMLADEYNRRAVIVDTSNEIAGDGDIPHAGIGRARRMQVPQVDMQHEIMIEAVENHMPQTVVIDEIGTALEAFAAGTIAQRGVQLVGTAHGVTVENLIKNPSLNLLAGGIQSVTLGDEEARRRGVQKSVLERKGPPTFSAAVEMVSRNEWRVHRSLAATVDALLAGRVPKIEIRKMSDSGQVLIGNGFSDELESPAAPRSPRSHFMVDTTSDDDSDDEEEDDDDDADEEPEKNARQPRENGDAPLLLYTYQVTEGSLMQVLEVMGLEESVQLTNDIGTADVVLALRSKLKSNDWVRGMAKYRQLPIFAIKANTMAQMVRAMRTIFQLESLAPSTLLTSHRSEAKSKSMEGAGLQAANRKLTPEDEIDALEEARLAIEQLVIPRGQAVELLPRTPEIIALQIKLVEGYQLVTERAGTYLNSRLRILPTRVPLDSVASSETNTNKESFLGPELNVEGGTSVSRLPMLPE